MGQFSSQPEQFLYKLDDLHSERISSNFEKSNVKIQLCVISGLDATKKSRKKWINLDKIKTNWFNNLADYTLQQNGPSLTESRIQ